MLRLAFWRPRRWVLSVVHAAWSSSSTVVVAVDVGKTAFAFSVTDGRTVGCSSRSGCPMTRPVVGAAGRPDRRGAPGPDAWCRVGVEAAGHYHRPLLAASGVAGRLGGAGAQPGACHRAAAGAGQAQVKTDAIDLEAMTELLLAGRGQPVTDRAQVLGELTAWSAHRSRRVAARTATKNQLLGQLDRAFPGLTLACRTCWAPRSGGWSRAVRRPGPARRAGQQPGSSGSPRPAACRSAGRWPTGWWPPPATRCPPRRRGRPAGPGRRPGPAGRPGRAGRPAAEAHLARLLPRQPVRAPLTSVPGWGVVRAGNYGAAVGDPARWPGPPAALPGRRAFPDPVRVRRQTPRRRDQPRRQRRAAPRPDRPRHRPVAQRPGRQGLRRRPACPRQEGAVIACAMAHRANRIAFALVRDQTSYDPTRWTQTED